MALLKYPSRRKEKMSQEKLDSELFYSARRGDFKSCSNLIIQGANPNSFRYKKNGFTCMLAAASNGHTGVVSLLYSKGADINAKDNENWTSLHRAMEKGFVATVAQLIECKCDIWANSHLNMHVGCGINDLEMMENILSQDPGALYRRDREGGAAPLHWGARLGQLQAVVWIIQKGTDIHLTDQYGNCALHYACSSGNAELVIKLISLNANIEQRNHMLKTPLDYSSLNGHKNIDNILIQHWLSITDITNTMVIKPPVRRIHNLAELIPVMIGGIKQNPHPNLKIDTSQTDLRFLQVIILARCLRERSFNLPPAIRNILFCIKYQAPPRPLFMVGSNELQLQRLAVEISSTQLNNKCPLSFEEERIADNGCDRMLWVLFYLISWPFWVMFSTIVTLMTSTTTEGIERDTFNMIVLPCHWGQLQPLWTQTWRMIWSNIYYRYIGLFFLCIVFSPFIYWFSFLSSFYIIPNSNNPNVTAIIIISIIICILILPILFLQFRMWHDPRLTTVVFPQKHITKYSIRVFMAYASIIFDFFQLCALGMHEGLYSSRTRVSDIFLPSVFQISIRNPVSLHLHYWIVFFICTAWIFLSSLLLYLVRRKQLWILRRISRLNLWVKFLSNIMFLTVSRNLLGWVLCSDFLQMEFQHSIYSSLALILLTLYVWSSFWIGSYFLESYSPFVEIHITTSIIVSERTFKLIVAFISIVSDHFIIRMFLLFICATFFFIVVRWTRPADNVIYNFAKITIWIGIVWCWACSILESSVANLGYICLVTGWFLILLTFGVIAFLSWWGGKPLLDISCSGYEKGSGRARRFKTDVSTTHQSSVRRASDSIHRSRIQSITSKNVNYEDMEQESSRSTIMEDQVSTEGIVADIPDDDEEEGITSNLIENENEKKIIINTEYGSYSYVIQGPPPPLIDMDASFTYNVIEGKDNIIITPPHPEGTIVTLPEEGMEDEIENKEDNISINVDEIKN